MAGHSHWAGIKHKKGRADKERSKIFSKLSREITVAAKLGDKDPDMNPRLRTAIQAAKQANMPKEIISRVNALLRRSRPALINNILELENLKISLNEMTVTYFDKNVKLGPKEFKLLTLLMERPGHIFSRGKLLDLVWGHGVYVEERTVDVHMSRLRKALKTASDENLDPIRTVRDGGYGLFTNKII